MSWLRSSPLRASFGKQQSRDSPPKDADPTACYDSFCKHWQQTHEIIRKTRVNDVSCHSVIKKKSLIIFYQVNRVLSFYNCSSNILKLWHNGNVHLFVHVFVKTLLPMISLIKDPYSNTNKNDLVTNNKGPIFWINNCENSALV